MRNIRTCSNCKWWSDPVTLGGERLCNLSKVTSFGAYGQDGKAIITAADFGCRKWAKKINVITYEQQANS